MWGSGISDACVRNWAEVMKDTSEIRRAGDSIVKYFWRIDQKHRGLFSGEGGEVKESLEVGGCFLLLFFLLTKQSWSLLCVLSAIAVGHRSTILKSAVDCRFLFVWHVVLGAFLLLICRMWSATCFIINYIGITIKVLITDSHLWHKWTWKHHG